MDESLAANDIMIKGDADQALKGNTNFLTAIDFSQIDEIDPNFFNEHRVIFDGDVSLESKIIIDHSAAMLLPDSPQSSVIFKIAMNTIKIREAVLEKLPLSSCGQLKAVFYYHVKDCPQQDSQFLF